MMELFVNVDQKEVVSDDSKSKVVVVLLIAFVICLFYSSRCHYYVSKNV